MAKQKIGSDKVDLDNELDMPDFDFDFGDAPKNRTPEEQIFDGVKEGASSSFRNTDFIRRLIRESMPPVYGDVEDVYNSVERNTSELYNKAVKEIKPSISQLTKATNNIIPSKFKKTKDTLSKIKEWSDSDKVTSFNRENAEEIRSKNIAIEIGEVFSTMAKAQEEQQNENDARDTIKESFNLLKHKENKNIFSDIRHGVNTLVTYQDKITQAYQKKTLELQYRSYFTQLDILEENKKLYALSDTAYQKITKNTALPEYVKIRDSERFKELIKTKTMESLFGTTKSFIDKSFKNAGNKLREYTDTFKSVASEASFAADMVGSTSGLDPNSSFLGTMAQVGTEEAIGYAGRKAAKGIRKATEKIPGLNTFADNTRYNLTNLPEIILDWVNKDDLEDGIGTTALKNFLKDMIGNQKPNMSISQMSVNESQMPSFFSNRNSKSINEIIPGYLARILREIQVFRTGDESIGLTVYDPFKNKFDSNAAVKKNIKDTLLPEGSIRSHQYNKESIFKLIDPENKLDDNQKDVVFDTITKNKFNNKLLTPEKLSSKYLYSSDKRLSEEQINSITEVFRSYFSLSENDEKLTNKKRNTLNEYITRTGSSLSNPASLMQELVNLGYQDQLSELGLLKDGSVVDIAKVIEGYNSRQTNTDQDDKEDIRTIVNKVNAPKPYINATNTKSTEDFKIDDSVNRIIDKLTENNQTLKDYLDLNKENQKQFNGFIEQNVNTLVKLDETLTGSSIKEEVTNTNTILERIESFLVEKLPELISTSSNNGSGGNYNFQDILNRTKETSDSWWSHAKATIGKPISAGWKYITKPSLKASWWGTKKTAQSIGSGINLSKNILSKGLNKLADKINKIKDIFVPGEREPRLKAAKLKAGMYYDSVTNKIIKTMDDLKDLKGDIIDKETGNIVLELKDMKDAFVKSSTTGAVISLAKYIGGKIFDFGSRSGSFLLNTAVNSFQRLTKAASWVKNKALDLLDQPIDIYVKGDDKPTLLATIMRNGGYISEKTSKPILRPSEIDGPLFDSTGKNYALTLEQLKKGLVDADGKAIKTPGMKLLGIGASIVGWTVKKALGAGRFVKDLVKGGLDHTSNFFKGMLESLNNGFGGKKSFEVLEQIRNILDERLPKNKSSFSDRDGDGDRDGSWQDKMASEGEDPEAAAGEKTDTLVKPGRENTFDRIARLAKTGKDKILGLLGLGDDEDEDTDIDVDVDGAEGDGKRKKGRKKPKGKSKGGLFKKGGLLRGAGRAIGGLGKFGLATAGWLGKAGIGLLAKGLPLAGSAIGAAVSAVPAILGGIGAVVSSPVFLTGAAVALAGYGAYKAYKHFTKKEYSFLVKMRMAQYGLSIDQTDKMPQIMELENQMQRYVKMEDNKVDFNVDDVLIPKLLQLFGISPEADNNKTREQIKSWLHWFNVRFKPTYSTHLTVLHNLSPSTTLDKVDDLDGETKVKYINATRETGATYGDTTNPFPDNKIEAGEDLVNAYAEKALEDANKQVEKDKKDSTKNSLINTDGAQTAVAGAGAAATATAVASKGDTSTTNQPKQASWFAAKMEKALNLLKSPFALVAVSPFVALGSAVFKSVGNKVLDVLGFSLTALEAIRFKTYGLIKMERSKISSIKKLEEYLLKDVTFDGNGNAYYVQPADKVLSAMGSEFGISDLNSPNASSWVIWFNRRFLPVYLNYVGLVRQGSGGSKATLDDNRLSEQTKLDIANKLITTPDIWSVTSSPWLDVEMGTVSSITKENISFLESKAKDKKVNEEKKTTNSNNTGVKNATAGINQTQTQTQDSSSESTGTWDRLDTTGTAANVDKKQTTDVKAAVSINTDKRTSIETNNKFRSKGSFGGFGEDIDKYITEASEKYGIDEKVLRGFIKMEAGWGNQMSPTGAIGVGQFTQGTWDDLAKTKEGQEIGMTKIGNRFRTPDDPRYDKRMNTLATALLAKRNADQLKKAGIEASGENLYMMHNIGPGFIKALSGEASPATVKAMQLNGMKQGMTPTQFLDYQRGRFNQHYETANQGAQPLIDNRKNSVPNASGAKEALGMYKESNSNNNNNNNNNSDANSGSYAGSVEKTKPNPGIVVPPKFAREDVPANADEFASIMKRNRDMISRSNRPDLNSQDVLNTQLNNSVTSMHKTLESSLNVQKEMLGELKQISQAVSNISLPTPAEQPQPSQENKKQSPVVSASHSRKQEKFPRAPVSTS